MSGGNRAIRVLLVEDSPDDAELIEIMLRASGYQPQVLRVDTLEQFALELDVGPWDIVLADYMLTGFTGMDALQTLKRSGGDIPFILISGSVGEETAVEAMKAGARDFFLKGRLTCLGSAIERELRQSTCRRERQEATTALRESEARKSAILASAFDGVVAFDESSRIVEFNPAAEKMFGFSQDQVLGKDLADLLIPYRLRAQYREGVKRFLETGEGPMIGKAVEIPALRADGSEFPVELGITIVEGQKPRVFTGFIRDISERKQACAERERLRTELEQALRARDEFLSIASHELKTPITALELQVASGLQLLRARGSVESSRKKLEAKMEGASRQVQRLTALVNNLLEVTRVTSGRRPAARKHVDLLDVVQGVLARLHPVIERSCATVVLRADGPVVGSWDRGGLETVASNLISNAVKYGEGKPIQVSVEREGERARLVITDLGLGIASEDQKRIFHRFERAVPARHYGGFGLGLWIVRNIVEAHDGLIRVVSQAGEGSTFTVELPLGRREDTKPAQTAWGHG